MYFQPNCVAEVVRFEREQKIIIISNRRIEKGEEVSKESSHNDIIVKMLYIREF